MVRIAFGLETDLTVVAEAAPARRAWTQRSGCTPHVVVLDLTLPTCKGARCFETFRQPHRSPRVVIYAGGDSDRRWYEKRKALFVLKGENFEDLVAAVRSLPGTQN